MFQTKFTYEMTQHRQKKRTDLTDALWNKFAKESELLDKEMKTTLSVLRHFETPKSRSKRALLPFVGDALSSLFGTATSNDLDAVLSRVNDLSDSQNAILSVVDNTVTLINQTVVDVNDNRRALNRVINVTDSLTTRMSYLQNTLIDDYLASTLIAKIDAIFFDLTTTVRDFREEIMNLETTLSLAENGIISRALMPPSQFITVLKDIQTNLPRDLALPFNPKKVHKFYANIHSEVIRNHTGISVILTIPLLSMKNQFTVYQIFNVPVPKVGSTHSLIANYEIPEAKFVALSDDSLKFVLIDDHDMQVYLRRQLPFCPLRQAILNVQTSNQCIPALLTNQTDKIRVNCEKTIRIQTTDPTAQYLGNGNWLVISADPIDLDIRCKDGIHVKPSHHVTTASPLSIVKLDLGCGGFSEYFEIPIHFQKDSSLDPYQIHYLNLTLNDTDVWKNIHSDLNLNNLSLEASLKMLPPSQSKMVSISLLKAHIKSLQSQTNWHYRVVVPSVTVSTFTVAAALLALYVFKRRCSTCLSILFCQKIQLFQPLALL